MNSLLLPIVKTLAALARAGWQDRVPTWLLRTAVAVLAGLAVAAWATGARPLVWAAAAVWTPLMGAVVGGLAGHTYRTADRLLAGRGRCEMCNGRACRSTHGYL